jgi:hypothetical protein
MAGASQANQDTVAELYVGFFGRAPDASGFQYWIGQLESGVSPYQIAAQFATTPEFEAEYGHLTTTEQVSKLYINVLNRLPDAPGLSYWVAQINSGAQTFADVVYSFTNAAFSLKLVRMMGY